MSLEWKHLLGFVLEGAHLGLNLTNVFKELSCVRLSFLLMYQIAYFMWLIFVKGNYQRLQISVYLISGLVVWHLVSDVHLLQWLSFYWATVVMKDVFNGARLVTHDVSLVRIDIQNRFFLLIHVTALVGLINILWSDRRIAYPQRCCVWRNSWLLIDAWPNIVMLWREVCSEGLILEVNWLRVFH